jgi:hypothetical protein
MCYSCAPIPRPVGLGFVLGGLGTVGDRDFLVSKGFMLDWDRGGYPSLSNIRVAFNSIH